MRRAPLVSTIALIVLAGGVGVAWWATHRSNPRSDEGRASVSAEEQVAQRLLNGLPAFAAPDLRDFYVRFDVTRSRPPEGGAFSGWLEVWSSEAGYRSEARFFGATTSKVRVLRGDGAWDLAERGGAQQLEGDARAALVNERERVERLVRAVLLQPFRTEGASVAYDGMHEGAGTYEGDWAKISCQGPHADVTAWFAHEGDGPSLALTDAGVFRYHVCPLFFSEDWILRDWVDGAPVRHPRLVEGYRVDVEDDGRSIPTLFLSAKVKELRINAGVDPTRFDLAAK